jgi:hypothetical protein
MIGIPRNAQAPLEETFLKRALAGGDISVAELEERARSAGLLGEHNHIGDAKRFKSAKKRLGIVSRRDGFGRGGEWFWQLPSPPSAPMPDVLSSPASNAPVSDVYAGGLSWRWMTNQIPRSAPVSGLVGAAEPSRLRSSPHPPCKLPDHCAVVTGKRLTTP